jgi:hypothetical protein
MEICPVGAALINVAEWMDTTKLAGAFHNYVNMPHSGRHIYNRAITILTELNCFATFS